MSTDLTLVGKGLAKPSCDNRSVDIHSIYILSELNCQEKTAYKKQKKAIYKWRDNISQPSIDRIDSDKDYVIDNCRFIEHSINSMQGLARARARKNNPKETPHESLRSPGLSGCLR